MIAKINMKKEVLILLFIILLSPFVLGDVYINEFELNPTGTDTNNEWVELYSDSSQDLTGWYIMDKNGNNHSLPSTTINGFYVFFMSFLLLNHE